MHRDVKPENILYCSHSRPVLADLGIAADLTDAVDMQRTIGSPGYAAPEVLVGKYDELADIFSSGCVLYYALSGVQPFQANTVVQTLQRTAICKPRYPHAFFVNASAGLQTLMKDCLSKNPADRPGAQKALDRLSRYVRVHPTVAPVTEAACFMVADRDHDATAAAHSRTDEQRNQAAKPNLSTCPSDRGLPDGVACVSAAEPFHQPELPQPAHSPLSNNLGHPAAPSTPFATFPKQPSGPSALAVEVQEPVAPAMQQKPPIEPTRFEKPGAPQELPAQADGQQEILNEDRIHRIRGKSPMRFAATSALHRFRSAFHEKPRSTGEKLDATEPASSMDSKRSDEGFSKLLPKPPQSAPLAKRLSFALRRRRDQLGA